MREFLLTPKYERNVSERTTYKTHGISYTVERYYRSMEVRIVCEEPPFVDVECVFGNNLIETLNNQYPGSNPSYKMFDVKGIEFPYDMPDDIRENMDNLIVTRRELWVYTELIVVEKQKID